MNIDNILFRSHSIGDLMGVKGLGDTGKKRARYTYIEYKYGRRKSIKSKYLEKGIACEDASLQMVGDYLDMVLVKNEERKENDFITGECDTLTERHVIDVKNAWDIFTYSDSTAKLNTDYEWQLRCYMELYNRDYSILAYTLNDAPEEMVLDALYYESRKYKDEECPEWIQVELIKSMIFTQKGFEYYINMRSLGGDELTDKAIDRFIEIPEHERIHIWEFERNKVFYGHIENRVTEARNYLKTIYEPK